MPTHALVHFPNIDTTGINALREEYDPYKDLIDVHITVVFPVQVDKQALIEHISEILAGWSPLAIRLKGLHVSFDQ
jgi:2'-5' RNA ligase